MNRLEPQYLELLQTITRFCDCVQLCRPNSDAEYIVAAQGLKNLVIEGFPLLSKIFNKSLPAPIYAKTVIRFGVEGLNNRTLTLIWEEYFLGGGSVSEVAVLSNYSPRTVQRRLKRFYDNIATQLWVKNEELDSSKQLGLSPMTARQRIKMLLSQEFGLSDKESDVYIMFLVPGMRIGRKKIARKLYISDNTLKTHIRQILKKTESKNMSQSVQNAKVILRNNHGNGFINDLNTLGLDLK